MPTVIDSLVVELGLDQRNFVEGQRDAVAALTRTKNDVASLGSSIEEHGKKISDIFGVMKGGAVGILGGLIGSAAANYVDHVAQMDAATSRLSRSIGMNVTGLSTWQGVMRQVGGTAADANQTFGSLTDALTSVRMGQGFFSGAFATLLNKSGGWQGKNPDQILRQISAYLATEQSAGRMSPQVARWDVEQIPGINDAMMNALLRGPEALAAWEAAAKKAGVETQNDADAAEDYQTKLGNLESAMMNIARNAFPVLTAAMNSMMDATGGKSLWDYIFGFDVAIKPGSKADKAINWLMDHTGGKDFWGNVLGTPHAPGSIPADGIPVKPGAGTASPAMQNLMGILGHVQGINQVTSLDDAYHRGFSSLHNQGRAMDVTINDPSQSADMAARIRAVLAANGIDANVIDEYMNPSAHATGGHIHIGLPRSTTTTSSVHVGEVHVHMKGGNADDVANNIGNALKRNSIASLGNNGMVG